jgi:signal transduction histidine kinase
VGPRRTDLLVGFGCAAFGAGSVVLTGYGAFGAAGAAILGGALGAARSHPRASWVMAAVGLLIMAPEKSEGLLPVYLFAPAHAFCAARRESGWGGVAALIALVGAWELDVLLADAWGGPALLIIAAGWGAGRALRERERVAGELAERVRELEEEREAHAALSVRYERARIASELHDIVAHAISVMVVQASAGQRLAARDPQATQETFEAIAGAARQAEDDMGRLVALLGDEHAIGPAPDLALVEELVARAAGSGLEVTLRLEGEREGLPAELVETGYHVVQEGLTNSLRYAAGAAVRVHVHGGREAILVEVANDPAQGETAFAGAGTGTGLQGLRERVGACGGTFEAGPTGAGGWRLSARLPRRVSAAAS